MTQLAMEFQPRQQLIQGWAVQIGRYHPIEGWRPVLATSADTGGTEGQGTMSTGRVVHGQIFPAARAEIQSAIAGRAAEQAPGREQPVAEAGRPCGAHKNFPIESILVGEP